jgi:hypothetical protein
VQFSPDGKYPVVASAGGVSLFDSTSWKKTDLTELMPEK